VNPDVRPRLTVVYGNASQPAPIDDADEEHEGDDEEDEEGEADVEDEPAPAPAPPPSNDETTMRVLHWNTHHGRGTDNDYDIERIAGWIDKMNADVVTLNEVERFSGGHGNEDQPARYAELLKRKTGRVWYAFYLNARGGKSGGGSAILSRFPITSTGECVLSSANNAVQATLVVNGRTVTVLVTHLPPRSTTSSSTRTKQSKALVDCAEGFPENRIITGDFNSTDRHPEVKAMLDGYVDTWKRAKSLRTAVDYPGNSNDGATYNFRIDYVFVSKGASALTVRRAQVFDTRDARGVRPSDHKPLLVTFSVR
jgi:endonuclease/exonuclease/phosphatase family metal-dependent hydrolase